MRRDGRGDACPLRRPLDHVADGTLLEPGAGFLLHRAWVKFPGDDFPDNILLWWQRQWRTALRAMAVEDTDIISIHFAPIHRVLIGAG